MIRVALSNGGLRPFGELVEQAGALGAAGCEVCCAYGERPQGGAWTDVRPPEGLAICAVRSGLALPAHPREQRTVLAERLAALADRCAALGAAALTVGGPPGVVGDDAAISTGGQFLASLSQQWTRERTIVLAVENSGACRGSRELWQCVDPARTARVGACFELGGPGAEPAGLAIKRMGAMLRLVRVRAGGPIERVESPTGSASALDKLVELLRGLAYSGWIVVEHVGDDALTQEVVTQLRGAIEREPVVLTAYKGDPNAPRFAGGKGAGA